MSAPPTSGYYKLGQKIENSIPEAGSFIGWICTKEGTANNIAWKPYTSYTVNTLVHSNNKIYKSLVAGTSESTPPKHTTGTISDGSITWEYVGEKAQFKQYGAIED
jgi:hypothetical protein